MRRSSLALAACLVLALPSQAQTVFGGTVFTVQEMVGVGRIAANLRDEHGETFGSISGLWADMASWTRVGNTYTGTFLAAPDRGYNIAGTIDYAPRLNTLQMSFTPAAAGATGLPQNQIALALTGSTRMVETLATGGTQFFSGLDPVPGGVATGGARPAANGLPELPQAFNGRLALDAEGVVVLADGSRLVSDEYGPSIYRFAPDGRFIGALEVANSVRPIRNGVTDYSSNNPTVGQPAPAPLNPSAGRANNQGFEGLTVSPDGRTLFVGLQSAARQDINLASAAATRDHTRIFTYDISSPDNIRLSGEYVVQLPKFVQNGATLVAAQSELLALSSTQLLMLPRDSNGRSVGTQTSLLRQVEIVRPEPGHQRAGQFLRGAGGTRWRAEHRHTASRKEPAAEHQRPQPAEPVRPDQWHSGELREPVRKVGRPGAAAGAGPGPARRLLPVHRQRQRLRHHRWLPRWCGV